MRAAALRHRRLPDERARRHHKKRLPQAGTADSVASPVNNDVDPDFSLTGPITITVFVPPSTTAAPPALTTSTTTPPVVTNTPAATPPAATSTTSSSLVTTSTASASTSPPNGNGTGNTGAGGGTTPQPSVSVVPPGQSSGSASNPPLPGQNGALQSAGGLSTGAIVGIVIAILVVLIAAAVFFLRRKNVFARQKRRATWLAKGGIMGPKPISGYDTFLPTTAEKPPPPPQPPVSNYAFGPTERNTYIPGAATEAAAFAYSTNEPVPAMPQQQNYGLPAPPTAYGMPTPVTAQSPVVLKDAQAANVVCTFIPTLPDELSINTGDVVRILAEYDDGWALCMNSRDEQGMVPLECLDRSGSSVAGGSQRDTREYRRVSSLAGAGSSAAPLAPNRLN